jgi:hypothetical protein
MSDPVRLRDPSSGAPDLARTLLESAELDAPTEAELASLSQRVGVKSGTGIGSIAIKLGAITLAIGGLAALLVVAVDEPERAQESPHDAPPHPAPTDRPAPPAPPESAPAPEPPAATEPRTPDVAEPPAREPSRPPARVEDEVELLHRARTALRTGELDRALAIADEHARLHRRSRFADERERIAIEALARSGRGPEARRRYDALAARNPDSPYLRPLERALGIESVTEKR